MQNLIQNEIPKYNYKYIILLIVSMLLLVNFVFDIINTKFNLSTVIIILRYHSFHKLLTVGNFILFKSILYIKKNVCIEI